MGGLTPPRNLLLLFLLVIFVPAASLIVLGVRLLEQDRALANQRQVETLDRGADLAVRALELDLAHLQERLSAGPWAPADVPEGSVHITLRGDRLDVFPPGRLPWYPVTENLKEAPDAPFAEMEAQEFSEQNLERAFEIGSKIAGSSDPPLRAGALLLLGRVLRKMGRPGEALDAYLELNQSEQAAREPPGSAQDRSRLCTVDAGGDQRGPHGAGLALD